MTDEQRAQILQLVPLMRAIPARSLRVVEVVVGHREKLKRRVARLKAAYAGEGDDLNRYVEQLEAAIADLDAIVEELETLEHEARHLAQNAVGIEGLLGEFGVTHDD